MKWDVVMGNSGEFVARLVQNGAAYTMRGEVGNNNTVTYKIFDGKNQQVGLGGGVVQDARHLSLATNDMSGRNIYNGKIHIDHLPGN